MDLTKASGSMSSAASAAPRVMLVSTPPGWTELTRMPNRPSSRAAALVMPRMANLLALYAESPAAPVKPSIEEMLMIEPPPAAVIGPITAFMPSQQPTAFTSRIRRKSAGDMSAIVANFSTPALFTSTSSRPKASSVASTTVAHCASLVTSWWTYRQDRSPSTSPKTTRAPSETRCRTCDLPIPLAPPVIRATLPSSRPMAPPGPGSVQKPWPPDQTLAWFEGNSPLRRPMILGGGRPRLRYQVSALADEPGVAGHQE